MRTLSLALAASLLLLAWPPSAPAQEEGEELVVRARERFEGEEYDAARRLFQRYLQEHPSGAHAAEAAFAVGDCYSRMEEWSAAVEAYEAALEDHEDSPRAAAGLYGLASVKLRLGFVAEALEHLNDAVARSPGAELLERIHFALAETSYQLGNYREAIEPYTLLLRRSLSPERENVVRIKLADCYHRVGEFESARRVFESLLLEEANLFAGNPEYALQYAESLLFTGALDEADSLLRELFGLYPGTDVWPHVLMRLGDLERFRALAEEDPTRRGDRCRRAIRWYRRLLADMFGAEIADSATLRIAETAKLGDVDLVGEFHLPPVDELLELALRRTRDADARALILLRLARHRFLSGRFRAALDSYKLLVTGFGSTELARASRSEYYRIVRELMVRFYERGDFTAVVDYYLGDGQELELDSDEMLMLAESFAQIQMYERSRGFYRQVLTRSPGDAQRLRAVLGLARIEYAAGEHEAAAERLVSFLGLDPPAAERRDALMLLFELHAAVQDMRALSAYWYERRAALDTPELRASCLFKLAALAKINGETAEAAGLFEAFLEEFGDGIPGDARVFGYVRSAHLHLGDLYYDQGRWRAALRRYEFYIALFGRSQSVAWPLFQSANCRRRLGELSLAGDIYRELIRLYPERELLCTLAREYLGEIGQGGESGR